MLYHPGHQPRFPRNNGHRRNASNGHAHYPALAWHFPPGLERATEFCHGLGPAQHLPVRMTLIAKTSSRAGDPMAVYACPLCNRRSGWVIDRASAGLRRLWSGAANSQA